MSRLFHGLLRLFLTATFVVSGGFKLLEPDRFLLDVNAFHMVPAWMAYAVALGLPWLEVFAALGLWWKSLARGASGILGGMACGFIGILLLAEFRGLDLDCGCFGDWLVFPNLATHLAFNAGLAVVAFWLLRGSRTQARK